MFTTIHFDNEDNAFVISAETFFGDSYEVEKVLASTGWYPADKVTFDSEGSMFWASTKDEDLAKSLFTDVTAMLNQMEGYKL